MVNVCRIVRIVGIRLSVEGQHRLKPTPEKNPNQLKLVDAELDGSSLIEAGIRFDKSQNSLFSFVAFSLFAVLCDFAPLR
jgi:hypothetical protein